jgi:hypothetical protein
MVDYLREDLIGKNINATAKEMPTGEVIVRVRHIVANFYTKRLSVTKAEDWSDADNPPWQEAHYHELLSETYHVVTGWMLAVYRDDLGVYYEKLYTTEDSNTTITFPPGIVHNVLLGPNAEVIVWQQGNPGHEINESGRQPVTDFDYDYTQLRDVIRCQIRK